MKIGEKDGKVCVYEAHLPITIEVKNVQGTNAIHVEEHGEPEKQLWDDELGDSSLGSRLKYHVAMIYIHLESLGDDEIVKRWIHKIICDLFRMLRMLISGMSVAQTKEQILDEVEYLEDGPAKREMKKRINEIFDEDEEQQEEGDLPKASETPITELDLGTRAQNAMSKMAWQKGHEPPFDNVMLSEFKGIDWDEFYGLTNVGNQTINELKEEFKNYSWQ